MRFSTTAPISASPGRLLLVTLLLSSLLIGAIAVPLHGNNDLRDRDAATVSANAPLYGILPLEKRAPPIPKPKPKPGGKPGSPDGSSPPGSPPLRPGQDNTPEPNIPPPLTPGGAPPARPKTPTDKTPDRLGAKDPPVNPGAKPDPHGPIPSEAEMMEICNVPKDKAIFWSQTQDDAYKYQDLNGLHGDTASYPPGYVDSFNRKTEPEKWLKFARLYSRVYAKKASGEVRVMVPWEKGPTPDRVFHSNEWPMIKEGLASGRITKVIQVNPKNFAETRIYDPTIYGLTKRSFDDMNVDLDNAPWDVNLDALAEAWKRANE